MKYVKICCLTGLAILVVALLGGLYALWAVTSMHTQVLNAQKNRPPEHIESFDGSYCMNVVTEENGQDKVSYVNVTICSEDMQEIYCIKNEYRAFDFHWVTWERESNSFWLRSGDLGTFYYDFLGDGKWEKYSLIKENDVYFLAKGYGEGETKEKINEKEILERIPEEFRID